MYIYTVMFYTKEGKDPFCMFTRSDSPVAYTTTRLSR